MRRRIKKWYLKLRVNMAIAEIKRKKLPIKKGTEEEMQELTQAFEAYKKQTIEQLQEVYEKHCKAIDENRNLLDL